MIDGEDDKDDNEDEDEEGEGEGEEEEEYCLRRWERKEWEKASKASGEAEARFERREANLPVVDDDDDVDDFPLAPPPPPPFIKLSITSFLTQCKHRSPFPFYVVIGERC